jgi:lysophospholipase L1-like esterase
MRWSRIRRITLRRWWAAPSPVGMLWSVVAATTVALMVVAVVPAAADTERSDGRWTGAWATPMITASPPLFGLANWSLEGFANQSVRQVVRTTRGGSAVRIRLSNLYGATPLRLAGATLGVAGDGASVRSGTLRTLTFGHAPSTVLPAGRETASDAVRMPIFPLDRLSVTLFFAEPTGPATFHPMAFATSYRATGDHRLDPNAEAFGETSVSWYYLTGVDVAEQEHEREAVVAFGDSMTDGAMSTTDANNRYPDELAERLVAAGRPIGVLNAGLSGNQLLASLPGYGASGLDRFRRDVLKQPQVRTVIVLEGINDIAISEATRGEPVTAAQLVDGYQTLIQAAHDNGVRVIGATIMPTKGTIFPAYYTERGEAVRDAVNSWIRTGGAYDAVVDLDRVFADPTDPDRMRPEYNSGDGVHPNDTGMNAIAEAIDLKTL